VLRKLAVKRLTASDLTFFEWQFRNRNSGNQKAINLNADVFIDELYPGLPTTSYAAQGSLPLALSVYGPGSEGEYSLQRKITKGPTYKNWRLNGEFIYNPQGNSYRFNVLAPNDLAVFEFFGDTRPESAMVVFVASEASEDASLHRAFDGTVGTRPSMARFTPGQLARIARQSKVTGNHPIWMLVSLDAAVEAVSIGGVEKTKGLRSVPTTRRIPRDQLLRARSNADRVGELGELFANSYLMALQSDGTVANFDWSSRQNAASPYDFRVALGDEQILVDAKSTELDFDSTIYVSLSELRQMGYGAERYDLYRIYEMGDTTARMRVAEDVRSWARGVVEALECLPEGVRANGVSVLPSTLDFGFEIEVEMLQEGEEPEDPEEPSLFE
jgi:hypothetical protein